MKDIAIYGAGGLGKEVAILIDSINKNSPQWNIIGFFDDGMEFGSKIGNFGVVLGGLKEINSWESPLSLALCFGNPNTLLKVKNNICNPNISFPNLVHPSCWFGNRNSILLGEGNILQGASIFTTNIRIGNFNLLNGFINVGHDVNIGDYNVIMPRVLISGEVNIGNQNLLGANCFIKQQLKIGDNVTLSPLSALLTKPKDGQTYIGNPAKIFKF